MPHIGGAGMHATIQDSSNLGPSLNFAKAPLYVTKHSDAEFSSAHASNAYDPYNPVIDFAKYLNGENLEQEECVFRHCSSSGRSVPYPAVNAELPTSAASCFGSTWACTTFRTRATSETPFTRQRTPA